MNPPKCKSCGVTEWRHRCLGPVVDNPAIISDPRYAPILKKAAADLKCKIKSQPVARSKERQKST